MDYLMHLSPHVRDRLVGFFKGYKTAFRPTFDMIAALASDAVPGLKIVVHTLYVIFVDPSSDAVFASVHFISREMYLGLALPDHYDTADLVQGEVLKYPGLSKALRNPKVADQEMISHLLGSAVAHVTRSS